MGELIDAKEIAAILGYTRPEAAANLCRSGRLTTARKMGNAWCAEREEVIAYRDTDRPAGRGKHSRAIPAETRAKISDLLSVSGLTDNEIAKRTGVSHVTVGKMRKKLGLDKGTRLDKVDWTRFDAMLGTTTDAEIARAAGCQKSTVRRRREKLGIEPFCPPGNSPD